MPFKYRKIRGKDLYKVYNTKTGEVHSSGSTLENAKKQIKLLYMIENNPESVKGKGPMNDVPPDVPPPSIPAGTVIQDYSSGALLDKLRKNVEAYNELFFRKKQQELQLGRALNAKDYQKADPEIRRLEAIVQRIENQKKPFETEIYKTHRLLLKYKEDLSVDEENEMNNLIAQMKQMGVNGNGLKIKSIKKKMVKGGATWEGAYGVTGAFGGLMLIGALGWLLRRLENEGVIVPEEVVQQLQHDAQQIDAHNTAAVAPAPLNPSLSNASLDSNLFNLSPSSSTADIESRGAEPTTSAARGISYPKLEQSMQGNGVKTNKWLDHVKSFAKKHKLTYAAALKDPKCKSTYKK